MCFCVISCEFWIAFMSICVSFYCYLVMVWCSWLGASFPSCMQVLLLCVHAKFSCFRISSLHRIVCEHKRARGASWGLGLGWRKRAKEFLQRMRRRPLGGSSNKRYLHWETRCTTTQHYDEWWLTVEQKSWARNRLHLRPTLAKWHSMAGTLLFTYDTFLSFCFLNTWFQGCQDIASPVLLLQVSSEEVVNVLRSIYLFIIHHHGGVGLTTHNKNNNNTPPCCSRLIYRDSSRASARVFLRVPHSCDDFTSFVVCKLTHKQVMYILGVLV